MFKYNSIGSTLKYAYFLGDLFILIYFYCIDIFKLFFSDDIILNILTMTNSKLRDFLESHPNFSEKPYFHPITLMELYAFFGLMIEIGVFRLHKETLDNIFSDDNNKSNPLFKATMARDRFKNILRFLRFDEMATRQTRKETDSLALIREVLDRVRANLMAAYSPGCWLTIDEHLCRYRGRCHFRQYIPSKPDRYGIKIYVLADSRNFYPVNFEVYCGKQALSNAPKDLVLRLTSVLDAGHIICGDNFFTSLALSNSLSQKSVYYLGTIRKIRREIPKTVKDIKGLPPYSSRFMYCEDSQASLLSYITKKNKSVVLLSNIHSCKIIPTNSKNSKPTIILEYNHNKSGVDKLGQMLKEYRSGCGQLLSAGGALWIPGVLLTDKRASLRLLALRGLRHCVAAWSFSI